MSDIHKFIGSWRGNRLDQTRIVLAPRREGAENPWLGAIARCSRTGSSNPSPSSGESTNFRFPVTSASRLPDAPRYGVKAVAWARRWTADQFVITTSLARRSQPIRRRQLDTGRSASATGTGQTDSAIRLARPEIGSDSEPERETSNEPPAAGSHLVEARPPPRVAHRVDHTQQSRGGDRPPGNC